MGEQFFSKTQTAKEPSRGTATAATRMLLAKPLQIKQDNKPTFPKEMIGVRADGYRGYINKYLYTDTLTVEQGYFEALPLFFGCGVKGATASAEVTTGQGDYNWAFGPSMTAANSPFSFTLELGDDTQGYRVPFCMFERIKLAWTISQDQTNDDVSIEGDFFGQQLATHAFTGALSAPTVTPLNGKLSRLFVDTTWAGVGGTELANILRAAQIEILTGVHPKMDGSALKTFDAVAEGVFGVMLTLTLEDTSAVETLRTSQQNSTFQAVRLQLNGPQIGTGTFHKLNVDVWGQWEMVTPKASAERGDNLATAVFHGLYGATGAKLFDANLTTAISTI